MMLSVLSWLVGSRAGRTTAIIALALLAAGAALLQAFARGKAAEKAKSQAAALRTLQSRIKTDDEISRLPPDAVRERLRGWMRDDGE